MVNRAREIGLFYVQIFSNMKKTEIKHKNFVLLKNMIFTLFIMFNGVLLTKRVVSFSWSLVIFQQLNNYILLTY